MAWGLSLATSQSTNAGNNTSTVSATLYLTWSNANRYSNFTTSGSINIGGNVSPFTGPTSGGSTAQNGSQYLHAHSVTFEHDANGIRNSCGTSASFDASGTNTIAPQNLSTSGTTFAAIDYDRRPNTPSAPSFISRNRESISMSTSASLPGGSPSPPGISSYTWQVSTDSANWSTISGQTGSTLNWSGAVATTQYYFRALATSSEGSSAYSSPSTIVAGAPNQPATPTLTRTGTNLVVGLSTPASNGSTLSTFTLEYSTASDFPSGPNTVAVTGISASTQAVNNLTPGQIYYFRYKVGSNRGDSALSPIANITIPPIPTAPTITTALIKQVRQVTVDWDAVTLNGAALTSYQVEARFSSDGGSTWENSFTQIGTTNSSTTIFVTENLNIAKTYQFRVRAVTDVGNSPYSDTETLTQFNSIFISAYGYRHDGSNFNTAIQFAARYTGNSEDTITVAGNTYTGWKTIENVKRYDGTEFISLTQ
jgi:hypothetical protein